jgi:hypothetical protein
MKLKLLYAAVFAVFVLMGFFATISVAGATQPVDDNVQICHATNAPGNPYTTQFVDPDSIGSGNGGDHSLHTGPLAPTEAIAQALKDDGIAWGDIIPAHDEFPGLNWTPDGIAIYENGCALVTPTPSPTPEVTPSPTPTLAPTPTPSPSEVPTSTPSPTPTPEPTATPTATPTSTPPATVTATPEPTPLITPTPGPTQPPATTLPPVSLPPTGGEPAQDSGVSDSFLVFLAFFGIGGLVVFAYIVTRP